MAEVVKNLLHTAACLLWLGVGTVVLFLPLLLGTYQQIAQGER